MATPAESSKQVVLKGMSRGFKVSMPSDTLSDRLCYLVPTGALDKLALVITGRIDEDGTVMEGISQTEWRYRGSIEL